MSTELKEILKCGFESWKMCCFDNDELQEGCQKNFGEVTEIFINGFLNGWLSCTETSKLNVASKKIPFQPFEPSKN